MATLSQHYDSNLDVNPYYVPINKQLSPMYDKSKKTWSQRLKITKSEKASSAQMVVPQLPPPQLQPPPLQLNEYTGGLEFSPSALSRSMKYAEPWIYGTVRGIPARPLRFHPGQAVFAPMPSEIAVVICSCPEYLNGTKREVKKASICKKCKGSRLPLAPIGGTVRIRPTSTPIQQKIRPTNAATLRVASTKSRPSILNQTRDPYDLMRRTRLLSPEPKSISQQSEKSYRPNRGKSASPSRSRSRTPRSQLDDAPKQSPKSNKTDPWIVDNSGKEPGHRRSILRCNVNPYDLISNKSSTPSPSSSAQHHLSEFSPNHHDDDDDDADVTPDVFSVPASRTINQKTPINRKIPETRLPPTPSPSPSPSQLTPNGSSASTTKTVNYSNVKAIAGQRISFGENKTSSSLITQNGDSFMYENVTPVPLDNDTSPKHSAKKDVMLPPNQPKRPPRRKNDTNPSHATTGEDNDNGIVTVTPTNDHHHHHHYQGHQMSSQISPDSPAVASQRPSIKSILKRPLSAPPSNAVPLTTTAAVPKSSLNGDIDTGSLVGSCTTPTDQKQQHQHQHHHQIKRNSTRTTHENAMKSSSSGTNANAIVHTRPNSTDAGTGNSLNTMVAKSNGGQKTGAPETKTGSQFYIPLPQARKKVQFMVEDKIIQVDNACYRDDDEDDDANHEREHEHEHEHEHDNDTGKNNDNDDDEDDYHSAQEDDDTSDTKQIPNQMGKTSTTGNNTSNCYQNCYRAGVGAMNENIDATLEEHPGAPTIISQTNRSNDDHRHQQHLLKQQDAILNLLQQESNLVSSELLNSTKTPSAGHYQNLPLHHHHHHQEQEDEPHYEDVPDDTTISSPTIVIEALTATREDVHDRESIDARAKDSSPGDPKAVEATKEKATSQEPTSGTQPAATRAVVTATTSSSPLSRNAIRRTNSERHPCNSNIDTSSAKVILNFKDTMALRIKANRKDSRDIFLNSGGITSMQQSVGLFRPRDPPPPPPTASVNNQQERRLSNNHTNGTTKETTQTPAASNKTQTILITSTKDDDNENNHDYDTVNDDDGNATDDVDKSGNNKHNRHQQQHHPQHWQEFPSRNRSLSVSSSGLDEQKQPLSGRTNNTTHIAAVDRSANSCRAASNIYEAFDSLSPTLAESTPFPPQPSTKYTFASASQPNRTIFRVAPFNKTSSEIHRLKITHTDDDTKASGTRNTHNNANSQKKTSILINGDDCYSTVNVTNDTPLYQSSVVVADSSAVDPLLKVTSNTVTINVVSSSPRTPEEELIYMNNKINTLLSRGATRAIIPITGCSTSINTAPTADSPEPIKTSPKRGRTLITLDYDKSPSPLGSSCSNSSSTQPSSPDGDSATNEEIFSHEEELVKVLRNPVEAVRRNLVPHVCGKAETPNLLLEPTNPTDDENKSLKRNRKRHKNNNELTVPSPTHCGVTERSNSFVSKLLEDPTLSQLAEGLESDVVVKLIENSLKRLKESRNSLDTTGTKDNEDMNRLINMSLQRIKEERQKLETISQKSLPTHDADDQHEVQSNRGSISSGNSFSSANYEMFDFSDNNESDCYQSCSSELAVDVDAPQETRSKFYQMLVDATLAEIEISTNADEDHHYESIRGIGNNNNGDPIYEEITDIPPPLPLSPPPLNDPELEKKAARSMFEGASKYDILSYLVDAKERGLVREESFEYNINNTSNPIIIEEENDTLSDLKQISDLSSRISHLSVTSDSSEDNSSLTSSTTNDRLSVLSALRKGTASEIERNDSGVGSETSKSSRSKYQNSPQTCSVLSKISPIHLCEDCDGPVETQVTDSGVMFAPLVCRKCGKKRAERKEIITEIVETEEKYGRDLQIILEEFCQPMLVAGLLTQEQLSAIFLNTEELLENNQTLAERMRDALDIALEQGDDDLLTVNIGKIFLDFTQMLHAFESYCVRQAGASLLLANMEKEKELLRIFLKVSQMENTVLRRMNLNSFLMVPVQRVTKYPLLLARLYKVTPPHLDGRDLLKQAQEKIELHLNHINQEAKDVPTKLWRRISSSSPNRRASCEIDMINIKLRKMAIDILEWNHDEVRFAMEGRLLYTQPTDSNWKKGRTIKLNPVNALLVTNGKPTANYKAEKAATDHLNFPKHTGIREASLLVVKEKCGRYTLIREPLYLDRCIVCTEADWDDYFELQEISSKDTFIFKAEDGVRTKQWYTQLQYHAQGMGAWRKRRNALANIMINGMLSRA